MSAPLLIAVTLAYVGIAISEYYKKDYDMTLVWVGYSIANIGFILRFMK